MKRNPIASAVIACGLLALPAVTQAAPPIFTTFDCPAAASTAGNSINAGGQVAGYCSDGIGASAHGFVKSGATVTPFDATATSTFTNGMSINVLGQVAGYHIDATGSHGYVNAGGVVTSFSVPAAYYTIARGINALGQVTGEYQAVLDPTHGVIRGYVYDLTTGTFTLVDALGTAYGNSTIPMSINDSGQVAGIADGIHGFITMGGAVTIFDAVNASQTMPWSMNNSGEVTGPYYDANTYAEHGFVYSGGVVTPFDVPGAVATEPTTINDIGQVAGNYTDAAGMIHGFVKTGALFTTLDAPGASATWPNGINASGVVTGFSIDAFGLWHGFVTSAVDGSVTTPPPPPPPSCVKPRGARPSAGKGLVTAVGDSFVMVGAMRIDYAACTNLNYGGHATQPAVHDRIEWEGYVESNVGVMAKTLSFN